jgi:hypothetical protein
MIFHWIFNISGAEKAYPSGIPEFTTGFKLILFCWFCPISSLHILVPCCTVPYDFHLNLVRFIFTPICCVWVPCFIYIICILITYTGVQHDFHMRWCSCWLSVARRVLVVEQELQLMDSNYSFVVFKLFLCLISRSSVSICVVRILIYILVYILDVDVVEWSRALDIRLSEWCCSVSMVWVQIPSREEQKFDSSKM